MAHTNDELDRRSFLKALLVTAATATTAGGGAAYFLNQLETKKPVITTVSTPAPPPVVSAADTVITANNEVADLLAQIASAEAENLRLRSELEAAQRRLSALESANGDSTQANQALQTELAAVSEEVGILAGLVALYEQLDELNVVETVDGGLESFSTFIQEMVDDLPRVENGLAVGQQALDEFEAHLPTVESGREWLESHLARLNTFYEAAERILTAAVENAGSFLQKINEWFQGVRKWLPFGVGDSAAQVMASLTDLLDETPNTIHGLRRNVADPLDVWFKPEGETVAVRNRLLKPLKEETITPSGEVVSKVREAKVVYETEVVEPVKTVAKNRQLVREQIAAYRKKYEL
jgi:regulator of replication initiation timing